jgi:protein arginine kinase
MINEEDHLRLQVIGPGLQLPALLARAVAVDQALAQRVAWAVHPHFGHLTACHTNLGTGLRASVMLHLPALAETGELMAILRACAKLHLAVRGQHGEGSEAVGHCYQISNARSLGLPEEDYLTVVTEAVQRVVAAEHLARAQLVAKARNRLEDKVFRAWALLTSARRLTTEELLSEWSWVRLGVALDVLGPHHWAIPTGSPSHHRWRILDRLALEAQPAHLQILHMEGHDVEATTRDEMRADLVRRRLST